MAYGKLAFSIKDGLAHMTINNEAASNAIDLQVTQELSQAAIAINADASVKAVLIDAKGKNFGVGGDVKEFIANKDHIKSHIIGMTTHFHAAVSALRHGPAPVIVALSGIAAGGSFSLVCSADMVIAKRSAKLVAAYTRSGLTPDGGGTWFLPRMVGMQRAFEIFATNPTITADHALELGMVSRVVEDDAFESEVNKLVQLIIDSPPGALSGLKRLLHASLSATLEQQMVAEQEAIANLAASPSTMQRLMAFVERKDKG